MEDDPMFTEYKTTMEVMVENVELVDDRSVYQTSKAQMKEEFETSDNLEASLGKYVKNPGMYLDQTREMYKLSQTLREKYPEDVRDYQATLRRSAIKANLGAGACETQFETDIDYCQAHAMWQAGFCGLMAPTLGGALICGAGVIGVRALCGAQAFNTYENCVVANQE
jgi:hypothetical protein